MDPDYLFTGAFILLGIVVVYWGRHYRDSIRSRQKADLECQEFAGEESAESGDGTAV